ncbi:MAG: methyl-accepting chemotaxis protein [Gammaproteobacteria bacterium]|nr:methyl-accepting chemotaxis protein [Gammaproteobacteria bacterium]MBQ0839146.1 methyl-accepting chemotaxis protein [Gammaproteobacteria bacterium]
MIHGKPKTSLPVVGLVVVMIMLVLYLGFFFVNLSSRVSKESSGLQAAAEVRVLAYRIADLSGEAADGNAEAFTQLRMAIDSVVGLRKSLNLEANQASSFNDVWTGIETSANLVLQRQERSLYLNDVARALDENLPKLQDDLTKIVDALLRAGAPADQVAVVQAQKWRVERIGRNIDKMLAGDAKEVAAAAEQFNTDARKFGDVLTGMKKGDGRIGISKITTQRALPHVGAAVERFGFVSNSIEGIYAAAPALAEARQALIDIREKTPLLVEQSALLAEGLGSVSLGDSRYVNNQGAAVAGVVLILCIVMLGLMSFFSTRSQLKETAGDNQDNQEAILRLLNELEGLGEGDLRAEVTVTEDFTGAIADAINFAIIQLRELVARIVDTAENVSSSANDSRTTVVQLTDLSEHQAQEIAAASAAINEMAITIDQVSANAVESAGVADRSVSIASKGAEVVRSTIGGMDRIREQIQDTAKRIKRLGESSQEIGDIVSLINDIADQTNILSLNAAIQASMAGDAGRGFAVVADEVQRLAERSAGATKQIAALVKTIQTDTNEAVSSMEQTTAEVVSGASLTQNAGVALSEIETVSTSLAELIQDISTAARHQSTTAGHVSKTMNVIQDITTQTLDGTSRTASSVGKLTDMAVELRESVSGFKLPVDYLVSNYQGSSSSFADESFTDEHIASLEPELDETFEAASNVTATAAVEPARHKAPAHVESVLASSSAAMDEIDAYSESATDDIADFSATDDFSELEGESEVLKKTTVSDLEAELAGIDLGEFDIDFEDDGRI